MKKALIMLAVVSTALLTGCALPQFGKADLGNLGPDAPLQQIDMPDLVKNTPTSTTVVIEGEYLSVEPGSIVRLAEASSNLNQNAAVDMLQVQQEGMSMGAELAGGPAGLAAGVVRSAVEKDRKQHYFVAIGPEAAAAYAMRASNTLEQQTSELHAFSNVDFASGDYTTIAQQYMEIIKLQFAGDQELIDQIQDSLERDETDKPDKVIDPDDGSLADNPDKPGSDDSDGPSNKEGSNSFLWKPVSDTTRNLVVLLPAELNGDVESVTANGQSLRYASQANGNRSHWRGDKPGGSYGSPAIVQAKMKDGSTKTWSVPNAGQRSDRQQVTKS